MDWQQRLKTWVVPQPAREVDSRQPKIDAGMYHYQRPRDDGYMRFHLRVERNGTSLLIAGASEAIRMSRAGTTVMKRLLDGETAESLGQELQGAGTQRLLVEVMEIINELGSPSSRFPIFNLTDPASDPHDAELIAPFQADVEVSDLTHLREILQRLWDAGIPHARLLPAAELPDEQLCQAVEWAEDLGMIAGVRVTASWLFEAERIPRLAAVGTDYLLCPWAVDPDLHTRWWGADDLNCLTAVFGRVHEFEMTPVVEIPLIAANLDALEEKLSQLSNWNVSHAEVYALARDESDSTSAATGADPDHASALPLDGPQLRQTAAWIEETADEHAFHLTWLPPVGVKSTERIADQVRRGPRAGGDVTIRVLAGGDVLPPRGGNTSAGNLLQNSWSEIWACPVFRRYRQRVEANTRCDQCPGLAICAADCPANPGGWSHD